MAPSVVASSTGSRDYSGTSQACCPPHCLACGLMGDAGSGGSIVSGRLCELDMRALVGATVV